MGTCFLLMLVVATMSQLGHTLDNQLILPDICPKKLVSIFGAQNLANLAKVLVFMCKKWDIECPNKENRDHLFVSKLLN